MAGDFLAGWWLDCQKGSWSAYKGETLGQGRETVAQFLAEHKDLQDEIVKGIMAKVSEGLGISEPEEAQAKNEELPPDDENLTEDEEDMLEISDSDSDSEQDAE